jgi:hypothetical protein
VNWPKENLKLSIHTPVRCVSLILLLNWFSKVCLMLIQDYAFIPSIFFVQGTVFVVF